MRPPPPPLLFAWTPTSFWLQKSQKKKSVSMVGGCSPSHLFFLIGDLPLSVRMGGRKEQWDHPRCVFKDPQRLQTLRSTVSGVKTDPVCVWSCSPLPPRAPTNWFSYCVQHTTSACFFPWIITVNHSSSKPLFYLTKQHILPDVPTSRFSTRPVSRLGGEGGGSCGYWCCRQV